MKYDKMQLLSKFINMCSPPFLKLHVGRLRPLHGALLLGDLVLQRRDDGGGHLQHRFVLLLPLERREPLRPQALQLLGQTPPVIGVD